MARMPLSDTQIDRFSRQIILPQVGGAGQERLLGSTVALAGRGGLLDIVALYLAGAGIGRLALRDAPSLRAALVALNPDVRVVSAETPLGGVDADVLVACDAPRAELDGAAAAGRPLVAGGVDAQRGWFVVADRPGHCAGCAARQAEGATRPAAEAPRGAPPAGLSPAAGVVGSLMALAVLKLRLGIGAPSRPLWMCVDAADATLSEHALVPAADCPRCAAAGGR
jgi:molybdopterin/thiamine biosynthesis adenylyltransferase